MISTFTLNPTPDKIITVDGFRMGVACGAANAVISGAGLCRSEDIASLYKQIVTTE